VHVSDQERSKLDDKSEKYVFIGYDPSSIIQAPRKLL
jgi:hypothetical protein